MNVVCVSLSVQQRMDGFTLLGRQLRVAWASNPNATPMAAVTPLSVTATSDTIKDAVERIQVRERERGDGNEDDDVLLVD